MSRVMRTVRRVPKEVVSVEPFESISSRGVVTYGTAVDVSARVVRTDDYITASDGTKIRTPLVLYVVGDAEYLPREQDRVTVDEESFVVAERRAPRRLGRTRDQIGHVRLACRLEG